MTVSSVIVSALFVLFFYQRGHAESLARQAREAELRALQSQLEPHMLFNTLANLRVLIGLDPPRAQAMLDRLIAHLRATLNASRRATQPLEAEFAHLDDYLALMAVRMGPRLAVRLDLPAELAAQPVPPLLLQPLVENAIKHGLEPKVEGGRIEVRARREGGVLHLSVRDTGVGPGAPPAAGGSAFGLEQVRTRLATLYGSRATLTLRPAADAEGGALATLTLPLE
jgi:sensor histidine kinase YesM